jgi:hypothetical protein
MTPEETIRRIAEVAHAVSWQAGVGGMEIAGQIVSVLARHPEQIDAFLEHGTGWVIDTDLFGAEHGCLTFYNTRGEITTPEKLHDAKVIRRILRGQ